MAAIVTVNTNNPQFKPVTQAVLTYAGVPMSVCRTVDWICEPEEDFAGVDYLGIWHVVIGVRAIVSPAATASFSAGNLPGLGDRAGITLQNLQQVLMQKRQPLTYRIGPDVVVQAPQDPLFSVDAKNGPNPLELRIIEVYGAKACLIYFKIEAWIGGNTTDPRQNNLVLSNRWSVQTSVDDDWKTTIVTTGRMRVRTDVFNDSFGPPTPDMFRQAVLPLAVPDGFKRRVPEILVTADGTELAWQCIDEQQILNIGSGPYVTSVEGQVTTGAGVDYQDFKDMLKAGAGVLKSALDGDLLGAGWKMFMTCFPNIRNTFQLRLKGPPQGDRDQLFLYGMLIIADRFQPQFKNNLGGLISVYATFPIDKMEVELRGAALGTLPQGVAAFQPGQIRKSLNIGDFGGLLGWSYSTPGQNPNPPNARTSRGTFIGALLETALQNPYALPSNNQPSERGPNAADIGKDFQ